MEVTNGETTLVTSFQSTTKSEFDTLVYLGYTQKKNLALCTYVIHEGTITLDMGERLGNEYHKPEEREVLILHGNCQRVELVGTHPYITGSDGKPAKLYEAHVWGPHHSGYFEDLPADKDSLRKSVFNPERIAKEHGYFEALNENIGGTFPEEPDGHREWKKAFNDLIKLKLLEA